jgi:prepilin-type N-terminal cleavage/methylation domain-containing protein
MRTLKGFTLIELLVVIAIISLLMSVILASVREARDKAKGRAFRQEMNELIKAIELYRFDNPDTAFIPAEPGRWYQMNNNGVLSNDFSALPSISTKLSPYLKKMPIPPFPGSYVIRKTRYVCQGDGVTTPDISYYYTLVLSGTENIKYFTDWKTTIDGVTPIADTKCFSRLN